MLRAAVIAACLIPSFVAAREPRFRWTAGQTLTYRVSQTTTAVETLHGQQTTTTVHQLDLLKRWTVTEVADGTATLQMTLLELKFKTVPPSGEELTFDSTDPAKSHPPLRDEMGKFLNVPLTVVRLDATGRLIEVKESRFGPANRLEADLPFKLTLPAGGWSVGTAWERSFALKLDPPQEDGDSFTAVQKYQVRSVDGPMVTVAVTTAFRDPPESAAEQLPLLPWQPEGECVFDTAAGRLTAATLRVRRELVGHNGGASRYQFSSEYRERLVGE